MKTFAVLLSVLFALNDFAHLWAEADAGIVFDLAQVAPDQLREVSDAALCITNLLGESIGIREKFVHKLSPAHAEGILKALASSNADI